MLPGAADDDRQKWTTYRFTPDGCLTLRPLFDNGFGQWTVLTSEGTAAGQALLTFGVTSRPCLTFPLLSA
ncbi:hypothetical protein [Micromonospora sp. NPDC047074]|uniref:hypothetical protein n=1 Tax=Micromonospora sp. NPDC047074 TaxID=3154339 RepID=UPI003400A0C7